MKKRLFYNDGSSVWIGSDEATTITTLQLAHYDGIDYYCGERIATYREGRPVRA